MSHNATTTLPTPPDRIHNWLNTQLSIARFAGGMTYNGHNYTIAYDEPDQPVCAPYKTFKDYIEAARKPPGAIIYGSTGTGSSPHLLMEELAGNAKVQLTHVPFKGNADLQQALLGGHVSVQSDATGWVKYVDGGQMRLLLTFGEKRTQRWPEVPTAKELGYGVVSTSPYGLAGPKGMDPAVVQKLHDAFKKAMDDPRHAELMVQLNQDAWYRSARTLRNGPARPLPRTGC